MKSLQGSPAFKLILGIHSQCANTLLLIAFTYVWTNKLGFSFFDKFILEGQNILLRYLAPVQFACFQDICGSLLQKYYKHTSKIELDCFLMWAISRDVSVKLNVTSQKKKYCLFVCTKRWFFYRNVFFFYLLTPIYWIILPIILSQHIFLWTKVCWWQHVWTSLGSPLLVLALGRSRDKIDGEQQELYYRYKKNVAFQTKVTVEWDQAMSNTRQLGDQSGSFSLEKLHQLLAVIKRLVYYSKMNSSTWRNVIV